MSEQLELDLDIVSQFPFGRGQVKEVLDLVFKAVAHQDEKWGEQNHPVFAHNGAVGASVVPYAYLETAFKKFNAEAVANGTLGWDSILLEELFEALAQADVNSQKYEHELVQTAAVCVAMILANRRKDNGRKTDG